MKYKFLLLGILICQIAKAQTIHHIGAFPTIDHIGTLSNKFDYGLYYFSGFNVVNSEINGVNENHNEKIYC